MMTSLVTIFVQFITTCLSRQLSDELRAWSPRLVKCLIRKSVALLPETHQERFKEEWESHTAEIPGDVGKLIVAIGYLSAARNMRALIKDSQNAPPEGDPFKRSFDLLVSLVIIIFVGPSWLLISAIVRLDSRGATLITRECIGKNGKPIFLRSFRTRDNAVGRFLRGSRVASLPLLFSILRGDISVIGPRPLEQPFHQIMTNVFPAYSKRTKVRPGVYGLAAVMMPEDGQFNAARELEYDLSYVDNRSVKLEMTILIKGLLMTLFGGHRAP